MLQFLKLPSETADSSAVRCIAQWSSQFAHTVMRRNMRVYDRRLQDMATKPSTTAWHKRAPSNSTKYRIRLQADALRFAAIASNSKSRADGSRLVSEGRSEDCFGCEDVGCFLVSAILEFA